MIKSASILAASLSALAVAATVAVFVPLPAAAQSAKNLKCKGCVNSRDIRNNGIKSRDIKDGQVRTSDLADDAVTGDKIAEGAVGASKLGADVVTNTATPISGCTTISDPGSYVLTQNITLAPGTTEECIAIAADFVTLDLAGFMIGGTGDGEGITDLNSVPRQGIAIFNGTVTEFDTGINLSFTTGGQLHGLRVFNNGGRGIDAGSGFIVSNNVVNGNGSDGIFLGLSAASSTISGNIANNNGGGIRLSGDAMTVIGNTANSNGANGITVRCPSNVINNTALNNTGDDLSLSDTTCNVSNNLPPP